MNRTRDGGDGLLPGRSPQELEALARDLGQAPYRGRQLAHWLYRRAIIDPAEMKDLPRPMRDELSRRFPAAGTSVVGVARDPGGEVEKFLLEFPRGGRVEAVRIGDTACLSSQLGCPLGCRFCRTATMGFVRDLSAGEILAQFLALRRRRPDPPVNGVVFMGMGEPLRNTEAVFSALHLLSDPDAIGLSARQITVSTVGIVPGIEALGRLGLPVTLAISLHAADNELRTRLLPVNRLYPLEVLLPACTAYFSATGRRLTWEYCLLAGVNDSPRQATALVRLLESVRGHVNLIRFNPFPGAEFSAPSNRAVARFRDILERSGLPVTVRASRGAEILAACGQLATERGTA